ncbi:MAG: hypothetical protein ACRDP1_04605 [Nocardioidaceae bacterium]
MEIRIDGALCTPASDDPFAASWIAIQQRSGTGITQIGFDHHYSSDGSGIWCRFWAIGTGFPHFYACGGTPDENYVYFQIVRFYLSKLGYFYQIADCGQSGGYGNCTVRNESQGAYSNPEGAIAAETDFGCAVRIMGSSPAPTHYGSGPNPTEGMVNSWDIRTWSDKQTEGDCTSDYTGQKVPNVAGVFATWDSRN